MVHVYGMMMGDLSYEKRHKEVNNKTELGCAINKRPD